MVNEPLVHTEGRQSTGQEQLLDGLYRVGRLLHQSGTGAVHETEFGEGALPAVIRIRRADPEKAGQETAEHMAGRWRKAMEFDHPNLLRVYAAGSSTLFDVPVVYVVMERADESLAGVLAERALSEQETRQMLAPAIAGLRYLHKNGYAHSALKPSNILARGDTLKLSSDSARPIGDEASPAGDIWALGDVIVQALTRKRPKIVEDLGPYILRESSQLFTDVVRHCLDPDAYRRWNLDRIEARLEGRPAVFVPPVVKLAPPVEAAGMTVVEMHGKADETATPDRVAEDSGREDAGDDTPPGRFPRWSFAALAAVVLVVAVSAVLRMKPAAPVPAAASLTPAFEQGRAAASRPAATPAPVTEVKPSAPAAPRKALGWSVIVAAYNTRGPAEKRRQRMARRWPKFNPVVRQQPGKGPWLVVLGQNLSEDQAGALRKRAVASGLPRDTYIKRLP